MRAPTSPDPLADRGSHRFTYSLLAHPGDFRAGAVVEEAHALNVPLTTLALEPHAGRLPAARSFFTLNRPGVVIGAIKKAEDGEAVIVRCYEAWGSRGPAVLGTTLPFSSVHRADLLENALEALEFSRGNVAFSLRPFEIVTLRFA